MIMDQDNAFIYTLINYIFKMIGIKNKAVAPYNPQSLQVELGIKSLASILTRHLTDERQYWSKYLPFVV